MTLEEALKVLREELRKDPSYYYTWQANIAVRFQDELARNGYRLPNQHEISNDAAKNFLTALLSDR